MFRPLTHSPTPRIGIGERFGLRSVEQVASDLREVVRDSLRGQRFQFNWRSLAILRPRLSLPAYAGLVPRDGIAPIFNLFDRTAGGQRYRQRVARTTCRDYRGGALTYDEHDGTDIVCPPGTPLCAAAPGVAVMIRHRWLRGGLTIAIDHGAGLVTQYTHCSRPLVDIGQTVRRGDPVALSGSAGYDMVQFFPWVAPHIHFLAMLRGRPVDPFRADGEPIDAAAWRDGDEPRPSGPLADDPRDPTPSPIDVAALERVAAACTDPSIQAEIAALPGERDRPALAALLEDALCHDAWAFDRSRLDPASASVRPVGADTRGAYLTLPLPASDYQGVRLADTRWSVPR